MRFKYSIIRPGQEQLDSLPRIPVLLQSGNGSLEAVGLVDSGATVNVLPFSAGQQLGFFWNDQKANLRLAGNLENPLPYPFCFVPQWLIFRLSGLPLHGRSTTMFP